MDNKIVARQWILKVKSERNQKDAIEEIKKAFKN